MLPVFEAKDLGAAAAPHLLSVVEDLQNLGMLGS